MGHSITNGAESEIQYLGGTHRLTSILYRPIAKPTCINHTACIG